MVQELLQTFVRESWVAELDFFTLKMAWYRRLSAGEDAKTLCLKDIEAYSCNLF